MYWLHADMVLLKKSVIIQAGTDVRQDVLSQRLRCCGRVGQWKPVR